MTRTIWKYTFSITDVRGSFDIPVGAQFLKAHHIDDDRDVLSSMGVISLWFSVDPEVTETNTRAFELLGSGAPYAETEVSTYIDSFLVGGLVLHLFEVPVGAVTEVPVTDPETIPEEPVTEVPEDPATDPEPSTE